MWEMGGEGEDEDKMGENNNTLKSD